MNNQLYYFLLPYCFIVRGQSKNIIFNAQQCEVTFISESILNLIDLFDSNSKEEIEYIYRGQEDNLNDIISYLQGKNLIYLRSENDIFPHIDIEYHSPEHIKHLVVEYFQRYNFNDILSSINSLLVKYLEIRYIQLSEIDCIQGIKEHIAFLYQSVVKSVQLIIDYKYSKQLFAACKLKEFDIITNIVFFNSPFIRSEMWENKNIEYVKIEYDNIKYSNNDYNKNYILDMHYFMLSHYYNPYYFKRLCVDEDGNIKNCIKNSRIFGNVEKDNLLEIIYQDDFRELWNVSPDRIIDVKDNPMRYNMYITDCLQKTESEYYEIIKQK